VAPEVTDLDQHVLHVNGYEPSRYAPEDHPTGPAAEERHAVSHLATPADLSTATLQMAGEEHARRSRISAAGRLPFSRPCWPSKLQRSNIVTSDTSIAAMNARQSEGEIPFKAHSKLLELESLIL
jgi:hypothetical protein